MSRKSFIIIHASFWILHMIFIYLAFGNYQIWKQQGTLFAHNLDFLLGYCIKAILFYTNYFFIIPYYEKNRKVVRLIILQFVALLGATALTLFQDKLFDIYYNANIDLKDYFFWAFITLILFVCVSSGIKFAEIWYKSENETKILIREKLSAEIAFLKSQINPHFLFNTLNNIYSLALTKSPYTSQSITRLKDMMQYMNNDYHLLKVSLNDEIEYLKNYIELEKLRLSNKIKIDFELIGNFQYIRVEPLLFIPFVENAFKHGNVNSPKAHIHISFSINDQILKFTVSNFCKSVKKDFGSGIGLKNVQRRLELLYKDKYELVIDKKDDIFYTELILNVG